MEAMQQVDSKGIVIERERERERKKEKERE